MFWNNDSVDSLSNFRYIYASQSADYINYIDQYLFQKTFSTKNNLSYLQHLWTYISNIILQFVARY